LELQFDADFASVANTKERREAQELAQSTPNVAQVVNQIEVRR